MQIKKSGVIVAGFILLLAANYKSYSQDFIAQKYLKLDMKMEGDSVKIYYTNLTQVGFSIQFSSFKTLNINTAAARNKVFIAKPSSSKTLLVSFPIGDIHKSSSIHYDYSPKYGYLDVNSPPPSKDIVYSLPYKKQEKYVIGQGYLGKFSHQNLYALDFNLPEHTGVYAARAGEIVEVTNDFSAGGITADLIDKANEVSVLHADGSIAIYSHFQYHGIKVHEGQLVKEGEFLGFSGHTGLASGPHLHFCVFIPTKTGLQSIPTKFWFDTPNHSGLLEEHKSYTSI